MTGWHVDGDSLRSWVDGTTSPTVGVSIEQHLMRCGDCRAEVARYVPAAALHQVWENVLADLERPRPGCIERLLIRRGLNCADSRVLSATIALRPEWLAAMTVVLSFAVLASIVAGANGIALFLVGAPLVPVAGVAMAYGPSVDPQYELALAARHATARLVLMRTAAVLVTSIPLTVAAGLLLPESPSVALVWLLPAGGFVGIVLTASIWVDPVFAAGAVAIGWILAVAVAVRDDDALAVFAPVALLGYLGLAVIAGLVLLGRRLGAVPSSRLR